MFKGKELESIEGLLNEFLPFQQAFPELIKSLRVALTIPVTSATQSVPSQTSNALKLTLEQHWNR